MPICKASRSVVAWHRVGSGRVGSDRIGLVQALWHGSGREGSLARAEVSSSAGSFSLAVLWSRLRHCRLSRSRHRLRLAQALSPFPPSLSVSLSLSISVFAALSCGNPSWAGNISFLVVAKQELVVAASSSLQKQWRPGRLSLLKSNRPLV